MVAAEAYMVLRVPVSGGDDHVELGVFSKSIDYGYDLHRASYCEASTFAKVVLHVDNDER